MGRVDVAPGLNPLTNGLQIYITDRWVDVGSGEASKFAVNDTFYAARIDPKKFGKRTVPHQLLFKTPTTLKYSSTDGKTDPPTAAAGGIATFDTQTFYQALWCGKGGNLGKLALADVTQIFEYQVVMRELPYDERPENQ